MRTFSRLVAVVLALALAAGGLLVAIEIVLAGVGAGPWVVPYESWYVDGRSTMWDAAGVRRVFVLILILGVVLLLSGLLRRRPLSLSLSTRHELVGTSVARRSLERSLSRAATSVEGVERATSSATDTRARVVATSSGHETGDLEELVTAAVNERLGRLRLAGQPHPDVSVKCTKS